MRTSPAEQLRARARSLRRLATQLNGAAALTLHQRAGEDAWIGPVADHCRDDLHAVRREIHAAHDDLITAARNLDRQAVEADAAALTAGRVV